MWADSAAISVLAIDDHKSFLFALGQQLENLEGCPCVVQQATTTDEALDLLKRDDGIELILLDHRLGGDVNGLDLLKQLRADDDHRAIIMMTAYGDEYLATKMVKGGADDYLIKGDIEPGRLTQTINRVLERSRQNQTYHRERREIRQRIDSLTPREREVLDAIVSGLTNKQIAAQFYRSEKTIKIHRANVMEKMQAATPAELARMKMTAEPFGAINDDQAELTDTG